MQCLVLILHRAQHWNIKEAALSCPIYSVFDNVLLNVKRKFINPQNFT